ncbi:MAG: peptidase M23, partial [Spirochaetia bacterium]|nr:peptidase M23 [Spirochaetia bacterium]
MTREGLVEENLSQGTGKRISDRVLDAKLDRPVDREMNFSAGRVDVPSGTGKKNRLYQRQQATLEEEQNAAKSEQAPIETSPSPSISIQDNPEQVIDVSTLAGDYMAAAVGSTVGRGSVKRDVPVVLEPGETAGNTQTRSGKEATIKSRKMQQLEARSEAANARLEQAQGQLPKKKVVKHQRLFDEETGKAKHRLSFEEEVKPLDKSGGIAAVGEVAASAVGTVLHGKLHEAERDNSGVEAAHAAEAAGEGTARIAIHHVEKQRAKPYQKVSKLESKAEKANTRLLFEQAAEKQPELRKKGINQAYQKHRLKKKYQEAYKATKSGKAAVDSVGAAASSGASKAKNAVVNAVKNNKGLIAAIAGILLIVILLMSALGSCSAMIGEGGGGVMTSTYLSSDNAITTTNDQYGSMESALQSQLNSIESAYPGYDEYRYTVDEITHDPYALVSYLTAKYGNFTYAQVQAELQSLFNSQYTLSVSETVEVRYRTETRTGTSTHTDPETGESYEEEYEYEVEVPYNYYILNITLTNKGLDAVVTPLMTEEQRKSYQTYQASLGNRSYLFGDSILAGNPAGGGISYEIPPEALEDADFRAMITEAEKYLGFPYVWGGSSPSTSFDCSGFVSWVINHSVGSVGRQTANGLLGCCTY